MFYLFAIKVLLGLICFVITYVKRMIINQDSVSLDQQLKIKIVQGKKTVRIPSNLSYDILLPISFRMLLIQIKSNGLLQSASTSDKCFFVLAV